MEFYSSRAERLKASSSTTQKAYEKRNSKSFLKRNPHLKIMLFDLILVILFATIIIPFFMKLAKDIRFDDYKVTTKAVLFEETILISIKIIKLKKNLSKTVADKKIFAQVLNISNNNLQESIELPENIGDYKYITFKIIDDKSIDNLEIKLSSGKFNKNYKVPINR